MPSILEHNSRALRSTKSPAWLFGEKQAVARWRQLANLQRVVFDGVKTFGDREALGKKPWFLGDNSRTALLMSAKGKLGLPQNLPKLEAEVSSLPWRSVVPDMKNAIRTGRLPTLYRGTSNINPFWSTNAKPVPGPDGSQLYQKTYVHGSALPSAAANYGAMIPGGPSGTSNLVSRHRSTGAERFTPDWGQEMHAADVGNTWSEILQGMRRRLPINQQPALRNHKIEPGRPLRLPILYRASAMGEKQRPSVFKLPAYETKLRPDVNPQQGFSLVSTDPNKRLHLGNAGMIADIPNTPKWQNILRSTLKDEPYRPTSDIMAAREYHARHGRSNVDNLREAINSQYFLTPAARILRQILPAANRNRVPVIDWLRERAAEVLAQRLKFSAAHIPWRQT